MRDSLTPSSRLQMKRRGFKPDGRTFGSLMGAFAKVHNWKTRPKLLQNVHTAYENYLTYLEAVRNHNPDSPEQSVIPINAYLHVLSKAKQYQRMFDVYNNMDSLRITPDRVTFTTMLIALGEQSYSAGGLEDEAQAQAGPGSHAGLSQ